MFRSRSNNNELKRIPLHTNVNHVKATELTQHENADNFFTKTPQPEVVEGPAEDVRVDQNLDFSVEGRELPIELSSGEDSVSTEAPQNFQKTQVIYVRPGSEQSPSLFDSSNNFDDQPIEPQGAQFPQDSISETHSLQNFPPQEHNRQPHSFQSDPNPPAAPSNLPKALRPYPIGSQLSIQQLVSPPPSVQSSTLQQFHRSPHNLQHSLPTSTSLPDFSEHSTHSSHNFNQQDDFVNFDFMPKQKPLSQHSLPPPPTTQRPPSFLPKPAQHRPIPLSNHPRETQTHRPSSVFLSTPPATVRPAVFHNSFHEPAAFQSLHAPHLPQQHLNSLDSLPQEQIDSLELPAHQKFHPAPTQDITGPPPQQEEFWDNHQEGSFGSQSPEPELHIQFSDVTSTPSFVSSHRSPHLNQQSEQFSQESDHQQPFRESEQESFHSQRQNLELGEFKKTEDQRFQQLNLVEPASQKVHPSGFQNPQPSNHQPSFQPVPQQRPNTSFQSSRPPHLFNGVTAQKDVWTQGNNLQTDASQNPPFVSGSHLSDGQSSLNSNPLHQQQHEENNAASSAINSFGNAGIDFPIHSTIPATSFSCRDQQYSGYYADVSAGCQVFHVCYDSNQFSFLCPNGTLFDQRYMVCNWWYSVDCTQATNFYNLNAIFTSQNKHF